MIVIVKQNSPSADGRGGESRHIRPLGLAWAWALGSEFRLT